MTSPKKQVTKSLDDFRKTHDKNYIIPERLKAGIAAMTPGGWEYEAVFWKALPVSTTDGSRFRPQFEDFIVTVDRSKRIWCGSKALAVKMREML